MSKHVPLKAKHPVNFEAGKDENGEPRTFQRTVDGRYFYVFLINKDRRFNTDGVGIRSSVRIEAAMKRSEDLGSEWLTLDDADLQRLKEAAEDPSAGYPFSPARGVFAFIEELNSAVDELPAAAARPLENGATQEAQPS